MQILGFSGGLSSPSKTYGLTAAIVQKLAHRLNADADIIDLASAASDFGRAIYRSELSPAREAQLRQLETADILVVASPVYRAAYPGLFKHVFDLLERDALEGKIVVLAANGGSAHHALVIDSHLRPLLNSLGAFTVPTGIYSQASDFTGHQLTNEALLQRIDTAVAEVLRLRAGVATSAPARLQAAKV